MINQLIYYYDGLKDEELSDVERLELCTMIDKLGVTLDARIKNSYLRSFMLNILGKTKILTASKEVIINKKELTRNFKLAILHTPGLGKKIIPNLVRQ